MESLKKLTLLLNLPSKVKESLETLLWVKSVWNQVFPDGERRTWPVNFEKGVLLIAVSDHYELQSLQVNYLTILHTFRELYPDPSRFPIKRIKFIYRPKRTDGTKIGYSLQGKSKVVCNEDWQKVLETCGKISDPELSTIFQQTLKNYFKLII